MSYHTHRGLRQKDQRSRPVNYTELKVSLSNFMTSCLKIKCKKKDFIHRFTMSPVLSTGSLNKIMRWWVNG